VSTALDDPRAGITPAPAAAGLIAANLAVFIAVNVAGRLSDVLELPSDLAGVTAQR